MLDDSEIQRIAPSVFGTEAHERTSDRYAYIPTIRVVEGLRNEGWLVTQAGEQRVRDETRKGYQKHLLRFRHADTFTTPAVVGEEVPEIVLINSHDGSSAYRLHCGTFRFVCTNGMVVASETIEDQRIRHSGDVVGNVIEGVYRVVDELPTVTEQIREFKGVDLNRDEQRAFGRAAMALRWDNPEESGFEPEQVIRPRRLADDGSDIWTTFNRAQENLVRGGLHGVKRDANGRRKRTTAREVKGIDQGVRLNQALWTLAEEMRKLKAA